MSYAKILFYLMIIIPKGKVSSFLRNAKEEVIRHKSGLTDASASFKLRLL